MKKFLFTIWEFPQKIVAAIIKKLSKAEEIGEYNGAKIYYWKWTGGLSLSTNIFVPFEWYNQTAWQQNYVKHEYGHTIQSKMLGPIYLIVIVIPSCLWAWLGEKYREKNDVSYYAFYTEKWANKLGGAKDDE